MASRKEQTGREVDQSNNRGRIAVDQLVDCGPVRELSAKQKNAAQEGLQTFLATYRARHPTAAVPDNPTTSAVVAGLVAALTMDEGASASAIEIGECRRDRERDEKEVVVVASHDVAASGFGVVATGRTVAEHNPEYPADDRVIEAVYVDSVTTEIGSAQQDSAEALTDLARKDELDEAGVRAYAFPESRLAPSEGGPY